MGASRLSSAGKRAELSLKGASTYWIMSGFADPARVYYSVFFPFDTYSSLI
jgi:hypothetical protein